MREVVIVAAARTAIGSLGGALASLSAVELGKAAAQATLARAGVDGALVDEVIVGNVLGAGLGQNVARQILIRSGLRNEISGMTLNHVCGSGLRAIGLAAQLIRLGDNDVVLAGGTESMSNAPYLLPKARWGYRMGDDVLVDSMVRDGLWDVFNDYHMAITAENLAAKHGVTREQQDAFALASQQKAEKAIRAGAFKEEIVPVSVPQRKGDPVVVDTDEYPKFGTTMEGLARLKPAFRKDGTVTAGNASGVNDGAAMVLLMSAERARALRIEPLARVAGHASAGVDPAFMGYGPVPATLKALQNAGTSVAALDVVEANEAFAAQAIVVQRELGLPVERTNVNGGAIALGHPIGASGARILVTLLHEMKRRRARNGLATLCIGGGMGTALVLQRG